MTNNQIMQVAAQLPAGEEIARIYRAMEGDLRVISRDESGFEKRYTVRFDADDNAVIREF